MTFDCKRKMYFILSLGLGLGTGETRAYSQIKTKQLPNTYKSFLNMIEYDEFDLIIYSWWTLQTVISLHFIPTDRLHFPTPHTHKKRQPPMNERNFQKTEYENQALAAILTI